MILFDMKVKADPHVIGLRDTSLHVGCTFFLFFIFLFFFWGGGVLGLRPFMVLKVLLCSI